MQGSDTRPIEGPARWLFAALAYACVALALIGVLLPGLPTVPFLLVAAWAATRGSRRLDRWLKHHPRFGPLLAHWQEQRAIPTRAKWLAIALLSLSWSLLAWHSTGPWIPATTAILFSAVAAYLLSRPAPRPAGQAAES